MLFGLAALIWPGLTLAVLIILYGAYAVVDGVFAIVAGLRVGSVTPSAFGTLQRGLIIFATP